MRKNEKTPEKIKELKLSDSEKKARDRDVQLLCNMREERDKAHTELDGMTYVEYYDSNRKKDLAYLPPKVNKHDVMISSGVVREKDTSLLSLALSMDFEPDVKAFDADDMLINEYGDNLTDLNRKSREIEEWRKKRSIVYRELISQGDVFLHEVFNEKIGNVATKDVKFDPRKNDIKDYKVETRMKKLFADCETRMINGKKLYVSNINKEWVDEQDQVAILNIYSRDEAYQMYGDWERWEYIPTTVETIEFSDDGMYRTWNMTKLNGDNQMGEVMLFDPANNRFQIYLNGIPMLPERYLLTLVSPTGKTPIIHGKNEPISHFFYGKSQPSKTKVEEDVLNEATKLMIEGMRIDNKPPMGSRKNKVISRNVLVAGKISPDMRPGDLFPLLEKTGISPAAFSFYQLIKQAIDDKTVTPSFEGTAHSGDPTATQVTQEKEQQMLKLGLLLDGIIGLESRMTWMRIYSILAKWTEKYDPDMGDEQAKMYGKYRTFSVGTTLEEGQNGLKIFRFMTGDKFPSTNEQYQEEQKLRKIYGKEVRIIYMNPQRMRQMKEKFFVTVVPTPQSNDLLTQIVYIQNLRQAYELFGPQSINMEYAKQRFSILINEDYNKFFKKVDVMELLRGGIKPKGDEGSEVTGMYGGTKGAAQGKKSVQPIVK